MSFKLINEPVPPVFSVVNPVLVLDCCINKAPVSVPPAKGNLVPMLVAVVVAKFGSSPRAAANSLSVLRVAGDLDYYPVWYKFYFS